MPSNYNLMRAARKGLIAILLLGLAAPGIAAEQEAPAPDAPQEGPRRGSVPQVEDRLLRSFAAVNAEAEQIQADYAREFADAAGNAQQVQRLYQRMNKEIMAALAESEITMDQYKQVVEAAEQDPGLRARIVAMVEEIRAEMKKPE